MKRTRLALTLGFVLLLAGCNALGAPGTPSQTPEPSPTPSATPTATPTGEYPPGLAPDGVTGAFALADAHTEVLIGQSYTVVETREIRFANGTLYTREEATTRMAADGARYRYNSTVSGTAPMFLGTSDGTLVHASNGTVVARKVVNEGRTSYDLVRNVNGELASPASVHHGTPTNRERIAVVFDRPSNVSVERANESTYRVRATASASDTLRIEGERIRNVTAFDLTATVTADGLVREYRLTLDGTLDGEPVTVVEHVRYSAVGTTAVERPEWWDEAVRNDSS